MIIKIFKLLERRAVIFGDNRGLVQMPPPSDDVYCVLINNKIFSIITNITKKYQSLYKILQNSTKYRKLEISSITVNKENIVILNTSFVRCEDCYIEYSFACSLLYEYEI